MEKPQKMNGRPPLQDGKRNKIVNIRFTEEEFRSILEMETELGISRTDLIRSRLLHQSRQRVANAKDLISHLDLIGAEMGRAGNNINQLARYANILRKQNILSEAVTERFNQLLETYLRNQTDLEAALRKMIRMMSET